MAVTSRSGATRNWDVTDAPGRGCRVRYRRFPGRPTQGESAPPRPPTVSTGADVHRGTRTVIRRGETRNPEVTVYDARGTSPGRPRYEPRTRLAHRTRCDAADRAGAYTGDLETDACRLRGARKSLGPRHTCNQDFTGTQTVVSVFRHDRMTTGRRRPASHFLPVPAATEPGSWSEAGRRTEWRPSRPTWCTALRPAAPPVSPSAAAGALRTRATPWRSRRRCQRVPCSPR